MIRFPYAVAGAINDRILTAPQRRLGQVPRAWYRALVIGAALAACLVLPRVTPLRFWPYLALLAAGIAALIALMRWPALGLIALVIASLLVPSPALPGGLNIAVVCAGMLCGLWLLSMVVGRKFLLAPSQVNKPVLALISVSLLSFVVGQIPWFGSIAPAPLDTQLGGLAIFVLSAGVFLLVANQVRDLRWLQWLCWSFLGIAALHMLGWIAPGVFGPFGSRLQDGATGNSMFWVWTVALSFSQALYNRNLAAAWRIALAVLAGSTLYVAYVPLDAWKSGYLPILVTMAAIIGARSWRLALLLIVASLVPVRLLASSAIASDAYSYATRIEAWRIILELTKANPLLGFGPANYHWYTPLLEFRGYHARINSHNQYIDILAQIGLLGLGCVLWFAWEVGRLGWQLRDRAPDGFARAYVYGALGGLAGTLAAGILVDWFLPFVYNIGLKGFRGSMLAWLFLGGLVSIEQITRRQAQQGHPVSSDPKTRRNSRWPKS